MPKPTALGRAAEREAYAELVAALDTARSELMDALKIHERKLGERVRLMQAYTTLEATLEATIEWKRYLLARERAVSTFARVTR